MANLILSRTEQTAQTPCFEHCKDANGDYWWAKDNVQTEFPARGEKVNRATVALVKTLKLSITTQVLKKLVSCNGQAEAGYWVKVTEEK